MMAGSGRVFSQVQGHKVEGKHVEYTFVYLVVGCYWQHIGHHVGPVFALSRRDKIIVLQIIHVLQVGGILQAMMPGLLMEIFIHAPFLRVAQQNSHVFQ